MALLIAVKLLSGILEHRDARASNSAAVPEPLLAAPSPVQPDPSVTALGTMATNGADDPAASQSRSPGPVDEETAGTAEPPDIKDLPPAVAALLPAARLARDELHRDGFALTRDALATRLRRHGHPIANSSLTPLLGYVRHEHPADADHESPRLAA